jgi:hypothetical protein
MFRVIYDSLIYIVLDIAEKHYKCTDGQNYILIPKELAEVV